MAIGEKLPSIILNVRKVPKNGYFCQIGIAKKSEKVGISKFLGLIKSCAKTKNAVSCLLTVCREVFSAIEGRNHAKGHFILGMKNIMHVRFAIEKSAFVIIV